MARRSDQVAAHLAALGVRRGDSVDPHARQPGRALGVDARRHQARRRRHADDDGRRPRRPRRPDGAGRGPRRHHQRVRGAQVRRRARRLRPRRRRWTGRPGRRTDVTDGWERHEAAYDLDVRPTEHPGTGPDDRMLLYFTSGTTSRPKLVEHTQRSYPVGHLSTMYWIGLQPGDVHLNISSPGWAKHAWSSFFAPWAAEATVVRLQLQPVRPGRPAAGPAHPRGDLDLRAADGVADAHQRATCPAARGRCARSSAPASRSTPR